MCIKWKIVTWVFYPTCPKNLRCPAIFIFLEHPSGILSLRETYCWRAGSFSRSALSTLSPFNISLRFFSVTKRLLKKQLNHMNNTRNVVSFEKAFAEKVNILSFSALISSDCSNSICTIIQNEHMVVWRTLLPMCEETSAGMVQV